MKIQVKFIFFIFCLLGPNSIFSQDLAGFQILDNSSVGLAVAPFEKWGVAISDIDRNGWPDIFTIRWAPPGYSRIYLNNNGIFTDITAQSPLQSIELNESHTTTVSFVDYDNDGDRDIFLATETHLYLLKNDENSFTDVAASVGMTAGSPGGFVIDYQFRMGAWADYDLDGDLDVVIGQYNNSDLIFYQNIDGSFVDVASDLGLIGIANHQGPLDVPEQSRRTRHITWIDFDMDGDPDLNVGDLIYRNDGGQFTDITDSTKFNPTQIEAAEWFDFDNDGDLDYFKATVSGHKCELWENRDGTMIDISLVMGVSVDDAFRGITIGDYDNDGDQDILVQNNNNQEREVLFLNDVVDGERAFEDVARWIGLDVLGDRKGAAFFDYNMDGFLDLYVASAEHSHILYQNLTLLSNNWVGFMLEGIDSNRDAIGTLVKVYTGSNTQIRYTKTPSSWQCQDSPFVHFGIGQYASIDSVIVRWPSGTRQVLKDIMINQYHEIKESAETLVEENSSIGLPADFQLNQNYPNPFNPSTKIDYKVSQRSHVKITVFNLMGEQITVLKNEEQIAGSYSVLWNGTDQMGCKLPSGLYFYKLQANDFVSSRKMMLIQ